MSEGGSERLESGETKRINDEVLVSRSRLEDPEPLYWIVAHEHRQNNPGEIMLEADEIVEIYRLATGKSAEASEVDT